MNMRSIIFSLLFFIPALTFAGEIYGTMKLDGKAVAELEIQITKDGKVIATTTTDKNGFFSVNIAQVGKYKLELPAYKGATFEVFSTNNSTGYTLTLEKSGETWILKKQ